MLKWCRQTKKGTEKATEFPGLRTSSTEKNLSMDGVLGLEEND